MQKLLTELFTLYHDDVYRYCYSLCRDSALSEELVSDVFFEAVCCMHRFRGESGVKTWLFSIARHKWYSRLRRRKAAPPTDELSEFLPDSSHSPESVTCDRASAARIEALLCAENTRTQNVVRMRIAGYSFREIADRENISEGSARVIDFRARKKIREILESEGYTDE